MYRIEYATLFNQKGQVLWASYLFENGQLYTQILVSWTYTLGIFASTYVPHNLMNSRNIVLQFLILMTLNFEQIAIRWEVIHHKITTYT